MVSRKLGIFTVSPIFMSLLGLAFGTGAGWSNVALPEDQHLLWSYQAEGHVRAVSLSSDGSHLIVGGADRRAYLFSSLDNVPLWSYQTAIPPTISISSNGSYLAAGDYSVHLFSSSDNIPLWSYYGGGGTIISISDNSRLAAGSFWGAIWFFSASDNTPLWTHRMGYGFSVSSISISSDGSFLAVGCAGNPVASYTVGDGYGVYLFSDSDNIPLWRYITSAVSIWKSAVSTSISSNGSYIAAVSGDEHIYFFSNSDNTPLWTYEGISSASISSDGNYLAAVGDGKLYLFPRSDNVPLWSYKSEGQVNSISISSNGDYIVVGSSDNKVYLLSHVDNIPLWSYQTESEVNSVSISSDGSYIAAGSGDRVYLFSWQAREAGEINAWYIAAGAVIVVIMFCLIFMLKKR